MRDFFVTRERTATFAPAPGVGALRPGPVTRAPGLFLAGAWTATGWPATMESAVRSGLHASREALSALGLYRPQRRPGGGMSAIGATRGENVTADSVIALLETGRILTTPVLRAAVARLAPPMDTVASYHFGWIDEAGRPADGDGGKAVRPALALLSAQAAGAPAEVGVPGAVAVELVHNFSLLHDDLMDGDEQRRHRDTVWKVHGPAQAILVGDALFALANEMLLEQGTAQRGPCHPPADRRHPQADRRSGPGHLLRAPRAGHRRGVPGDGGQQDRRAAGLRLLHRRGARRRLRGRPPTRWRSTATTSASPSRRSTTCWASGATRRRTGKQTWSDLRQRKKSLPVVAALAAGGPASERLGELLAADAKNPENDAFSEEEFALRAALIEEAGGREWTSQEARRQYATAIAALDKMDMPEEIQRKLVGLADFVVVREK